MNRIFALLIFFLAISCFTQLHAQDGQVYIVVADSLYKNQSYQLAADNYSKAMSFYKNDNKFLSKLYDKRNKCERRLKLFPQAIADANFALSLDSENGVAYWDLGFTYGDSGNHKLSMKNYTKAMALYQDDAKSLSKLYDNRAYQELDSGLYKEAITDDSLAINLNVENGNAYLHRGLAFTKLRNFKNTVDNYTDAISHETDNNKLADLYNQRGIAEYELKNYLKAINDESYAIKLNDQNGLFYWFRGIIHAANDDSQLAIEDYAAAMNFFKNNNKALAALYHSSGINETDLQHFDKAISDINMAIKLDPGNEGYYSSLALAYTNNGDFKAGIENYVKAMPGCKDDKVTLSSYYSYCAENAYYLKDYKKVIENSTRAIELYPSHVSPYYYLGKVCLKVLNNKALAFQNFRKGMDIDTSKRSDSYIFSLFYTGDSNLAYKKMHDRILSDPENYQMLSDYYNMACLLSLMNKKEEANTYLKKAIDLGYSKKYALSEDDLNNIRDTQEFKDTMASGGEKQ